MREGVPVMAQWKRIRLGTIRLRVRSLASLSGLRIQHCCELWCRSQTWLRSGSLNLTQWVKDPALLWLWHRLATVASIRHLAWELPYATGAALERKKERKSLNSSWLIVGTE